MYLYRITEKALPRKHTVEIVTESELKRRYPPEKLIRMGYKAERITSPLKIKTTKESPKKISGFEYFKKLALSTEAQNKSALKQREEKRRAQRERERQEIEREVRQKESERSNKTRLEKELIKFKELKRIKDLQRRFLR